MEHRWPVRAGGERVRSRAREYGAVRFSPSHRPDDGRIDDASSPTGVAGLGRNRSRSDGWSPVLSVLSRCDEAASDDASNVHHRATVALAFVTVEAHRAPSFGGDIAPSSGPNSPG